MKQIPLSRGFVAIVDDEDFQLVSGFSWAVSDSNRRRWEGTAVYAVAPAKNSRGKWSSIRMHRLILAANPGERVDHVNGNGLDNRRSNLRFCTHQENIRNSSPRRKVAEIHSKYRGVSWSRRGNKWQVQIKVSGKSIWLGRFATEADAAKAYNVAALKYFGEFARLNEVS